MIKIPGNTASHHATRRYRLASESIRPHSAVGGCAPRPRNESAAMERMAVARPADVAGHAPDEAPARGDDRDRDAPHGGGPPPAVDEPERDVAAEVVGAQHVTAGPRRQERIAQALLVRVDGDEQRDGVRAE